MVIRYVAIRTHVTWWSCNNFPDTRQPDGLLDKMGIGSLAMPAAFLSSPNFFSSKIEIENFAPALCLLPGWQVAGSFLFPPVYAAMKSHYFVYTDLKITL